MVERNEKGQFKPGSSGNPRGRPRSGLAYLHTMRKALTLTKWRKIVSKAIDQAIDGDKVARAWLSEYIMGKPIQVEIGMPPVEDLANELRRITDHVYGDSAEGGLPEGPD